MNKLHSLPNLEFIFKMLDYITLFQLKYTCKIIHDKIVQSGLDKILELTNINIEDDAIYKILKKHKKKLTTINIEFRNINDTYVFEIEGSQIETVNLNGCQNVTDKGISHIAEKCPNLKKIEIYWIPDLTDKGVKPIIENCKKLNYLNISGLKNVSIDSLSLITQNLINLEYINLTRCIGVTDEFLVDLVSNLNLKYLNLYALPYLKCTFFEPLSKWEICKLEFLDLCGNQFVDDKLFSYFKNTNSLRNLKYLNLSWCTKVTDESIEAIYPQLDKLELLSLHGLLKITDKTVGLLNENENIQKNLHTLDLNGCVGVKHRDVEALLSKFPKLTCFKYHF